jgi:hypothetical protein
MSADARRRFTGFEDQFAFVEHVAPQLHAVVCGQRAPFDVIYPNGELFFVESTFTKLGDLRGNVYYNMYCQLICEHLAQCVADATPGTSVSILECGSVESKNDICAMSSRRSCLVLAWVS